MNVNKHKSYLVNQRNLNAINLIFIVIVVLIWLIISTPTLMYFISDPDGGFFIQGAYMIRSFGEHPQIDFFSSYGPLSFYLRAIAQILFKGSIFSEVAVVLMGYTLSFVFFYESIRNLTKSRLFSFLCLIAVLICIPRYYKFFVVLVPSMVFYFCLLFYEKQTKFRAQLIGVGLGIAYLFRHDYGVFAGLAIFFPLIIIPNQPFLEKQYYLNVLLAALAITLPWEVFLASRHLLFQNVIDLLSVSRSYNSGMGLPHPLFNFDDKKVSFFFAVIYSIPILLVWITTYLWQKLSQIEKLTLIFSILVSVVFLTQSMHRADIGHLFQCVAASLLGLSAVWKFGEHINVSSLRLLSRSLVIFYVLTISMVGWSIQPLQFRSLVYLNNNFHELFTSMNEVSSSLARKDPTNSSLMLIDFLHCLPDTSRATIFPFAPQLLYFATKASAGDTLLIAPGYFDSESHQLRIINSLISQKPQVVLWNESVMFSSKSESMPILSHHLVHGFVKNNFLNIGNVDGYTIYANSNNNLLRTKSCNKVASH